MRTLLLTALLCWVLPAFAASDLAACAGIESATDRLDCFDRLVREASISSDDPESDQPAADPIESGPAAADPPAAPPPAAATDEDETLFGREKQVRPTVALDLIEARIEHIRRTPLGHHVMTLSNEQVWVENEPGRRSIAAGQAIAIRKHRWHFEMELEGQPNVAVRRVR